MIDTAKSLNKPLSVCGEIAADPYFIPLLIGLGLNSISVDIHSVDMVRHKISSLDPAACRQLSSEVLSAQFASEVKMLLSQFSGGTERSGNRVFKDDLDFIDPICKMVVHTKKNDFPVSMDGKDYFFCCKRCMEEFVNRHY